jgi:hypothetical protein
MTFAAGSGFEVRHQSGQPALPGWQFGKLPLLSKEEVADIVFERVVDRLPG